MTKIIYRLFIFILIFTPLAFGTVEQWSLTVMETLSIFALILFLIRNIRHKSAPFYEVPGVVLLLLFLAYMLIQLIPLPPGVIRLASPETYSLYKGTVWVDGPLTWRPLSINIKASLMEFFRMASYASFYVLTVQLLAKKDLIKKTFLIVVLFASLLSFLGILQNILWNNKIFWVRELPQGGKPFGPYVNRNHYAGLMGMIFPVVLSLFLFYKPEFKYRSFRERISEAFTQKMTNMHILLGFSAILIATSIFLSLSRGGIISLSLSMIFFGGMIAGKVKKGKRGILISVTFILILYAVGWFGWAPILERFERTRDLRGDISELRLEIWKDSLNLIKDFAVTGTGFGSFINIYPKYRSITPEGIADHAHNDYIELLSDGGLIAVLLFFLFLIIVLYRSYSAFRKRHNPLSIYLFIGLVTGMVSILIHSITDFNLHIGANGLYFFFLAGAAVSAANTSRQDGSNETSLKKMKLPLKQISVPVVIIFILGLTFNIGLLAGKFYFSSISNKNLNLHMPEKDLSGIKDLASRASVYDPLESEYHYAIANIEWLLSDRTAAVSRYKKAVQLSPVNGEYLQALGLVLNKSDLADGLLRAGINYDVRNPVRHKIYASWLISRGEMEKGIMNLKTAISLEPSKTREYITLLVLYGLSDKEVGDSLPEMVEPHLLFADYLNKTGKDEPAAEEYLNALYYANKEKEIRPSYFYQAHQYFMQRGMYDNALIVMKKAMEALPGDVGIRLKTAETYEKAGITYRAVEEYRNVLIMDPGNDKARKKLEELG